MGLKMFIEEFLRNMSIGQGVFMVIGGIVGFIIALSVATGRYTYIGGGRVMETRESMGVLKGLLVECIGTVLGAGIGYLIGSIVT